MPAAVDIRHYVAANARRLREARGQNQQDAADLMGVSPRRYREIEAGLVNLTLRSLGALSKALDVEPMELLRPARLKKRGPGRPKGNSES